MRRILAGVIAIVLPQAALATPNSPKKFERLPVEVQEDTALCVIDVTQASISLGLVGTNLAAAVERCKTPFVDDKHRADCAASVSGTIYMLAYLGTFLSSAASDCSSTISLAAYCAADITNLVGSLVAVAGAGSAMSHVCTADNAIQTITATGPSSTPPSSTTPAGVLGQLVSAYKREESVEERQREIANCVFQVGFVATFLTRAALALNAAVRDCKPFELKLNGESARMSCAVDINGVIGSLAWTARALSLTISECPVEDNLKAECAAEIATVIAAVSGVAASASSFQLSCGRSSIAGEDPGVLPVRRLAAWNVSDVVAGVPNVLI